MTSRTHQKAEFREDGEDDASLQGGCGLVRGAGEILFGQYVAAHLGSIGRMGRINAAPLYMMSVRGAWGLGNPLTRRLKLSSLSSPSSLKGWQTTEKKGKEARPIAQLILPFLTPILPILPYCFALFQQVAGRNQETTRYRARAAK